MKQTYKTFDVLLKTLKINTKSEFPVIGESFANIVIDKINKIYNEISLKSDINLKV